uniref:Uncharacterized protein n=1 Tax=Cuerna arida TaxID=1464854 RepID=A0A1B6EIS9_9HEMI
MDKYFPNSSRDQQRNNSGNYGIGRQQQQFSSTYRKQSDKKYQGQLGWQQRPHERDSWRSRSPSRDRNSSPSESKNDLRNQSNVRLEKNQDRNGIAKAKHSGNRQENIAGKISVVPQSKLMKNNDEVAKNNDQGAQRSASNQSHRVLSMKNNQVSISVNNNPGDGSPPVSLPQTRTTTTLSNPSTQTPNQQVSNSIQAGIVRNIKQQQSSVPDQLHKINLNRPNDLIQNSAVAHRSPTEHQQNANKFILNGLDHSTENKPHDVSLDQPSSSTDHLFAAAMGSPQSMASTSTVDVNQSQTVATDRRVSTQEINESDVQGMPKEDNSVAEVLKCSKCRLWIYHQHVHNCYCIQLCEACVVDLPYCDKCKAPFSQDVSIIRLYQELSAVISHPCRYKDCRYTVKPRDPHEEICNFKPIECHVCKQNIAIALLTQHFLLKHPDQRLLKEINKNVKLSEFNREGDQRPKVLCFVKDRMIWINLNKFEDSGTQASFMIHTELNGENTPSVTIKFDFQLKSYSCLREVKMMNNVEYLDIPFDVLRDWIDNKCNLDVSIIIKPKRKKTIKGNTPSAKRRSILGPLK